MNLKNRYICLKLLGESSNSSLFINDIISNYFYNNDLDSKSKKFITNILLGVTRMKGKYDYIVSDIYNGNYQTLKLKIKNILRLGCYQIERMDSIPNHAAVSTSVEMAKQKMSGYDALVNALLRKFIKVRNDYAPDPSNDKTFDISSHPNWMVKKWIQSWGFDRTIELCEYNNKTPNIWFRINDESKIESVANNITDMKIDLDFHDIDSLFFKTSSPFDVINSKLFQNGVLTIQNPINASIVRLLNPKNNDTVIDGCSAPGGKGTFISILAPKSKIFSIDNNKNRMKKLKESIKRHKSSNINPLILDMTSDELPVANKILIDVPCSGTGVINRRVDLRWKRTLNDIEKSSSIQYNILQNASKFLSNGGVLVYSTCSIEKEENFNVIDRFLFENKNFTIEDASNFVNKKIVKDNAIDVLPGDYNLDGGFGVRLKKA